MSGIVKDATVRLSVEADGDIAQAANNILGPIERAAQNTATKLGSAISPTAHTVTNVAMDVVRVGTALGAIDLGSSVQRYVRFREEVARTAVSVASSYDALTKKYKEVGDKLGLSDEVVSKFARGLQQATYDTGDSSKAIEALGSEAIATNRSFDQMGPIAETLHNELGRSFDEVPEALGRIRTVADTLGTVGGPAALEEQITHLGGAISQFSLQTKDDLGDTVAALAELGRGLPAKQQERVQQRVVGRILSDVEGLRRALGTSKEAFYDEGGKIRDLGGVIEGIRDMAIRNWGKRALEVLSQPQNLGPEGARAMMAYSAGNWRAAEGPLFTEAEDRRRAFRESDIGEDIAKRNRIEQNKRDKGGGALAGIQAYLGQWQSEHPFASLFMGAVGGQLAAQALRWAFTAKAMGGLAGVGATAAKLSPAGRVGAGAMRLSFGLGNAALNVAGGSMFSAGLAAIPVAAAWAYGGMKLTGLDQFNAGLGQQREALAAELERTRQGRVYAIVRAAERANAAGFTPERYRNELGPRLTGEISRDPTLQMVASGAANTAVPQGLEQQAPQLAAALRDALKDVQLNVQVQLQDDTGSPHRVVAIGKGARQ